MRGQSISSFVPSVIKTNIPLNDDDSTHKEFLLQRYRERIEKLSQQDRLSKFCTDAGFLTTVEVGQYLMTKDAEEFSQFTDSVACREYTLPRDEDSSEPKGWIQGNTKIGPVLEVATCCLQGKYGVEIRIKSVHKDNSHSWVRISHGLNKLVTNLYHKDQDDNEQETSDMQSEEYALKLNAGDFASRSKAKAKPQRRVSASSYTRTLLIGERTETDVEPGKYSLNDSSVSKKLIHLLRHGSLRRDKDGAIEFWRIKDHLQDHFVFCHHWSDEKWKSAMAGGGHKKRFQYCGDSSGTILYLRALQGHSGRNLIDPSLQDNVIIPDVFFKYIYHVGCAINLHSIINSGLFFTKHSQLIVCGKLFGWQLEKVLYEKENASPRPPPKISLKHDWTKKLVSEVARQPEGEVARQAKSSQPTQPNPNPNHGRTGRPVVCSERAPRSQEIETRSSRDSKNFNLVRRCKSR